MNEGTVVASKTPRRNLVAASPAKLVQTADTATSMPQDVTVMERYFPIGIF